MMQEPTFLKVSQETLDMIEEILASQKKPFQVTGTYLRLIAGIEGRMANSSRKIKPLPRR
jgi:hypothetical protein